MTPNEAIETIKIAQAEVEWEYPIDYAAAFDEAVKALEKQIPFKTIHTKYRLKKGGMHHMTYC
jgi:septation ring formation regulator EzrA